MAPITSTCRRALAAAVQLAESHRVRRVEAAGRVDEDVQSTVALDDVGDERVYRVLIRDVEVTGLSLPARPWSSATTSAAWAREER